MLAELPPEKPSNDWRDHISVEELLSSEIVSASASTVTEDYAEDVGFDNSPPTTQIPTPAPRTSVATASRTSPAPVSRAVPTPALRTDPSLAPQTLPPPEEKKYKAVEVTSRKGVRESALYQLEDDPDHCLRFLYKGTSTKTGIATYHCLSCKQTKTDVRPKVYAIHVLNGEFDQDPMEIPHVCGKALRSYHKERTNSMLYEETQELRTSDRPKLPVEAYTVMFAKIAANTEFSHDDRLKIVKDQLEQFGVDTDTLTIVTDYEKSALVAIDKIFNKENCQGCSFHFCMAFNRRALTLDIYIERIPVIARWIDRLRTLMFFPDDKDLVQKSGVLKIPVPERHEAYDDCKSFLQYFQSTWMTGINAGRWQKFLQQTNRTSNIAESMHRLEKIIFK